MITFKQFIAEGYKKYGSPEEEAEHKDWKSKVAAVAKKLHDLYGGYAALHLYFCNDDSDLNVTLPKDAFDEDEFEWDIVKIGFEKALADNGIEASIDKPKIGVERLGPGNTKRYLEVKLKPLGKLKRFFDANPHFSAGKSYAARKYKR